MSTELNEDTLDKELVINQTEYMVNSKLQNEGTGHDWEHIKRVTNTARKIALVEGADVFIVTMAALLHDLADDKIVESEEEGLKNIEEWLNRYFLKKSDIEHILEIIKTISFRGGNFKNLNSLEAKVVQDADRLDAIGAVGIARCFVYSGKKGRAIYDPNVNIRKNMTLKEYREGYSDSINHFYEKLLKLKDLMNTEKGKEMAKERHNFMEAFLEQFYKEIDVKPKDKDLTL
jgi:uncharacterized protein